jgi:uncharacterized repeat protein (TIGR01451 family)
MKSQPARLSLFGLALGLSLWQIAASQPALAQTVQPPELKWQHGGCYPSWCETGWYSSPAVADLDGDGSPEIIASTYSIFVLEGATGSLEWQVKSGHDRSEDPGDVDNVGRTWPGVVLADVDADGAWEIVTAHSGGYVSVYNQEGYFQEGWPQRPTQRELRGLSVADVDDDGTLEIVVTGAVYDHTNTWVYEHNGILRTGWPQLTNNSGYAYGVFNDNAAVGDLDGDGDSEIVVPSDVHYICAYDADGVQLPTHNMYEDKGWGKVGVWESLTVELRGWGACNGVRDESYRTNFAHGAATLADLNQDGVVEVVATGNVYDCSTAGYSSRYNGVYIFNADRSRFTAGGYDWQAWPLDTGAPLSEDYGLIENAQPNPAVADLDGDGELEILYASYDGRVHAFWLDKTEHGYWPYSVYSAGEGFYRFASEPVVADLDNNGTAEVIFTSWAQKGSYSSGKLYILDYQGQPIHVVDLPAGFGSSTWNGALPAPTLGDVDGDPDLEVVLNTAHSGVVVYDLPNTSDARILWGTGRGNYRRSGTVSSRSLGESQFSVQPLWGEPGDVVTYTTALQNPGSTLPGVQVSSTLDSAVRYRNDLWASAGSFGEAGGIITWTGSVEMAAPVTITFSAVISEQLTQPEAIVTRLWINEGTGTVWQHEAVTIVNGPRIYLPVIRKG